MRYMKTVVAAVLIYAAVMIVVLVIAQVLTGYDFSAAYAAVTLGGVGELALSAIIKHGENKQEHKYRKDDTNE